MMTRQEQIEEMLGTIDIVLWDEDDEEITSTRSWLENELKEEKEKLGVDKAD
jgi:hypothetical protein